VLSLICIESKAVKSVQLTASEMLKNYCEEQPCLGRGCGPGELVDLTDSPSTLSAAKVSFMGAFLMSWSMASWIRG